MYRLCLSQDCSKLALHHLPPEISVANECLERLNMAKEGVVVSVPCRRRDEVEAVLDRAMELLSHHTCMVPSVHTHLGKPTWMEPEEERTSLLPPWVQTVSFDDTAFSEWVRNLQQLQLMLGTQTKDEFCFDRL